MADFACAVRRADCDALACFRPAVCNDVYFSKSARERHHAIWDSLTATIKQMSSGNFTAAASRKMEKIERNHPVTKLADELSTLAAELSEMEKLKQEFISNVSMKSKPRSLH